MGNDIVSTTLTSIKYKSKCSLGLLDLASFGGGLGMGYVDSKNGNVANSMDEGFLMWAPAIAHAVVGGYFGFRSDSISNTEDSEYQGLSNVFNAVLGGSTNGLVSLLETKIGYVVGQILGKVI